jgi:hypothetical protein
MGGSRSLARLADECGITERQAEYLSSRYEWVARAADFDSHVAGEGEQAFVDAAREMGARQALEAQELQQQALASLRGMDPASMSARDAIRLYQVASDIERLARGEPTEHVRTDGQLGGQLDSPASRALEMLANPRAARLAAELTSELLGEHDPDPAADARFREAQRARWEEWEARTQRELAGRQQP